MAVPLILVLSVPALLWFADHWTVFGDDTGRYLLAASQLISGQALEDRNSISGFNGGHGPVFPALIGALTVVFERDTAELVWTVRLMALLNSLLAYLLAKQLSSPAGGLVAAAPFILPSMLQESSTRATIREDLSPKAGGPEAANEGHIGRQI